MKIDFRIDKEENLKLKMGHSYRVESLTHPVLPNFLLVKPEIRLPDNVTLVKEEGLAEDGTHGCIYTLEANQIGKGVLVSSFLDLRTSNTILEKSVGIEVV